MGIARRPVPVGGSASGYWEDSTTIVEPDTLYTKTIPIGFAGKKGRVSLKSTSNALIVESGCLIEFSTDINDAFGFLAEMGKVGTIRVRGFAAYHYKRDNFLTSSIFGFNSAITTLVNTAFIRVISCYIDGGNLIITFKNTDLTYSSPLCIHMFWEVES